MIIFNIYKAIAVGTVLLVVVNAFIGFANGTGDHPLAFLEGITDKTLMSYDMPTKANGQSASTILDKGIEQNITR